MNARGSEKLKKACCFRLGVKKPFHFRCTFWKPSHFPTELEMHTEALSWRTFRFGKAVCGCRFEVDSDELMVTIFSNDRLSDEMRRRLVTRINTSYGLTEDISGFLSLARKIPALRSATQNLAGMRMSCPESIFEIAVISLLLQNTTVQRSSQMMRNLLDFYGKVVNFDGVTLRCFFAPEDLLDVTEEALREKCRLGYRAKYLPAFAKFFSEVDDDELRALGRDTVLSRLQSIKGVGPYTANIVASHALRDKGVVALDVWNTKIAGVAFLGREDASAEEVSVELHRILPGLAGLALLYLIEYKYYKNPVAPLAPYMKSGQRGLDKHC